MISNQILQSTIDGLRSISGIDMYVLDVSGSLLAGTGQDKLPLKEIQAFGSSPADSQVVQGFQLFKIMDESQPEYILVLVGGEEAHMTGAMAAFQIQGLLVAYKEKFDKDNFIKNLILDNLLLVDIYNRAKKLRIDIDAKRVVLLVETQNAKDFNALETVKNFYDTKNRDFITAVDEKNVIIIKELSGDNIQSQIDTTAKSLFSLFPKGTALVSYGTVVSEIKEVSRSYKEARMALDVGKIFFNDREIIAYSALGIGRLIYQLPLPLCRMFIKEIFDSKNPDDFDEETVTTINKFFDNNLNVSETSRQLYIHRNTLVYRLDKLQKTTGLDLRVFEDAITFKIALMVVKYMSYMEKIDF